MYKIQMRRLYPRTIPVVLVEVRAHLILYPKAQLLINRVHIIHNTKEQGFMSLLLSSFPLHSQSALS